MLNKVVAVFCMAVFSFTTMIPPGFARSLMLPAPDAMLMPSTAYMPAMVKGVVLDPQEPFRFDFIVNNGQSGLKADELRHESEKLIRYFFAALTVPEKELWVNLSPYEQDRIIPENFGVTDMGRDLLAQDYVLKQLSSSMMYPESDLGADFWKRVYAQAQEKFGTSDIPLSTFNKIWIVPSKATVYQKGSSAFVVDNHLKVMLEEDYTAFKAARDAGLTGTDDQAAADMQSQVVREVLLPAIEKEINEGRNFALLRQIANVSVLAAWHKQYFQQTIMGQLYAGQNKVAGIEIEDKQAKQEIFERYVQAFKTGVYNYIKEDVDPRTQQPVARKYFSGGANMDYSQKIELTSSLSDEQARRLFPSDSSETSRVMVKAAGTGETILRLNGIEKEKKPGVLRLGVLTSGGLAPHNPAIVEFVAMAERLSSQYGITIEVVGIPNGWKGAALETDKLVARAGILTSAAVEPLRFVGGSMLGSSRTNPTDPKKPEVKQNIEKNLRDLGFNALIPMGGDDTLGGAGRIAEALRQQAGITDAEDAHYVPGEFTEGKTADQLLAAVTGFLSPRTFSSDDPVARLNALLNDPDFYREILAAAPEDMLKDKQALLAAFDQRVSDDPSRLVYTNRQAIEFVFVKEAPIRLQVVGLPKTMDNDLQTGNANNYGFVTFVLSTVKDLVNLKSTESGLDRIIIKEVASRNAGFTALWIGAMVGALRTYAPERGPINIMTLKKEFEAHFQRTAKASPEERFGTVVISEGVSIDNDLELSGNDFEGFSLEQMQALYDRIIRQFDIPSSGVVFADRDEALKVFAGLFATSRILKTFLAQERRGTAAEVLSGEEADAHYSYLMNAFNRDLKSLLKAADKDLVAKVGWNRIKRLTRIILENTVEGCPSNKEAQSYLWKAIQKNPQIEDYLFPKGEVKTDSFGHPKLNGAGPILAAVMGVLFPDITINYSDSKALYEEREAPAGTEDTFITQTVGRAAPQVLVEGKGLSGLALYIGDGNLLMSTSLRGDMGGRIAHFDKEGEREWDAYVAGNDILFPDIARERSIAFDIKKIQEELYFGYEAMKDLEGRPEVIMRDENLSEIIKRLDRIERRIEAAMTMTDVTPELAKRLKHHRLVVWQIRLDVEEKKAELAQANIQKARAALLDQDAAQMTKGGIDLDPALIEMIVERDDQGVPLPQYIQRDLARVVINGIVPVIMDIQPVVDPAALLSAGLSR